MNPLAHIQKEVSFEKAAGGFMVADPLTLYDCCPTSDGASCVVLAADHVARQFTDTPIWVKGAGAASTTLRFTTGRASRNSRQRNRPLSEPTVWQALRHVTLTSQKFTIVLPSQKSLLRKIWDSQEEAKAVDLQGKAAVCSIKVVRPSIQVVV